MVFNHHLLNRRMTLITFQDGKVVMRDGQVGTEQACCCRDCLNFWLSPSVTGFSQADWDGAVGDCVRAVLNKIIENLQAAGWTASLDESTFMIDGEEVVRGYIRASCDCCWTCDDWVPIVTDRDVDGFIAAGPEGRWCNVAGFDPATLPGSPCGLANNPLILGAQPLMFFNGCGLNAPYGPAFDQDLNLVNYSWWTRLAGQVEGGGLFGEQNDLWVPCCNPDNCDGNPLP